MRRVRMRVPREWQNAGRQLPLAAGVVYDLPLAVADSFIATGVAAPVDPAPIAAPAAAELRETKPVRPREVKRGAA